MSTYSKEKQEIIEKQKPLYEKRSQIIAEGEEKKQRVLSKLTTEELSLVKVVGKYKKLNQIFYWIALAFGFLCSAGCTAVVIVLGVRGVISEKYSFLPWPMFIVGGLLLWFFFYQIVFGSAFRDLFIKRAKYNPNIKEYEELCEQIKKEKQEVEEQIKKLREKYAQYEKWENGEVIGKIICKTVSFIEEMGNSVPDEPRSDYTHSINDGGYRKNLKLDERQGGYDTTHGWHDTYKDEHGHSWGTTDGGKTFFKKD
ncbi:MAG: hypothetical protein IJ308_05555 [Clostridia bacterium]|nr:hypothetical protein [Clostridia bacterium]